MARTLEFGATTTDPFRLLPNRTHPTIDSSSQGLQAHSPPLNQLSYCASFSMTTASLRYTKILPFPHDFDVSFSQMVYKREMGIEHVILI